LTVGGRWPADHPAFIFQVVGQSRDVALTVVQAGGHHPGSHCRVDSSSNQHPLPLNRPLLHRPVTSIAKFFPDCASPRRKHFKSATVVPELSSVPQSEKTSAAYRMPRYVFSSNRSNADHIVLIPQVGFPTLSRWHYGGRHLGGVMIAAAILSLFVISLMLLAFWAVAN
jgi:hypothetical protein